MRAPPPTDRELRVHGAPAVLRRRAGAGPPLVLVPGCGRDHHDFDLLLEALVGPELLVPALPGRAGVPGPPPASAAAAARYVLELLDACGVQRAFIGGHSYGGAVALELAFAAPERVLGLALVSTGARLRVAPAVLEGVAASGDEVALADWRACDAFDRLGQLGRLRGPAAIVVGSDDVLTPPRNARYLSEHLVPSRLTLVDGAGHELPSTHPAALAVALGALWAPA